MNLITHRTEAIDELLDRQLADVESYTIRTDLFISALQKAIVEGVSNPARLISTRNMVASFVASAEMFEQKWLRQRAGVSLPEPARLRIDAMSTQISSCLQRISAAGA